MGNFHPHEKERIFSIGDVDLSIVNTEATVRNGAVHWNMFPKLKVECQHVFVN